MKSFEFRILVLTGALLSPAFAQNPPAHISWIKGKVTIVHGDTGQPAPAVLNAPLSANDRITTGPRSAADVLLDAANLVNLGPDSEIRLPQLDPGVYHLALGRGALVYQVLTPSNASATVDTPSVSPAPSREGIYRIAVRSTGESEIVPLSGAVEVFAVTGSAWVNEGQKMLARGPAANPEFRLVNAVPRWKRMFARLGSIQMGGWSGFSSDSFGSGNSKEHRADQAAKPPARLPAKPARDTLQPTHPPARPHPTQISHQPADSSHSHGTQTSNSSTHTSHSSGSGHTSNPSAHTSNSSGSSHSSSSSSQSSNSSSHSSTTSDNSSASSHK